MSENNLPDEQYLQIEEIVNSFCNQLKKDASMAGIELEDDLFTAPLTLSEMINRLHQKVQQIIAINSGIEKIQSWLYRVDVSESSIRNNISGNTKSYSEIVSEFIVKRTLQKVVLRYLYKNNSL
jgi:lambda repressor-like predicted transcriptional regulator